MVMIDSNELVLAGVDYCTRHDGIRNEDAHRCDMTDNLHPRFDPNDFDDDGELLPCMLRPMYYRKGEL